MVGEDDRPGRLWLDRGGGRRRRARREAPQAPLGELLGRRRSGRAGRTRSTGRRTERRSPSRTRRGPVADDWPTADISLVDVATGAVRPFAATGAAETSPRFSPDGRMDRLRRDRRSAALAAPARTSASPRSTAAPRATLPPSFDESPDLAGWSADGRTIYFTEPKGVSDARLRAGRRDRRDRAR